MKKGIGILLIIIVIYGILFGIDVLRFKNHKPPLIVFKVVHYDYQDGYVEQYKSIGYEFLYNNRDSIHGWNFNFGYSHLTQTQSLQIIYEEPYSFQCNHEREFIYQDDTYDYYIECVDLTKIYVKKGEEKLDLIDSLNNHTITIDDIVRFGFKVVITEK